MFSKKFAPQQRSFGPRASSSAWDLWDIGSPDMFLLRSAPKEQSSRKGDHHRRRFIEDVGGSWVTRAKPGGALIAPK